MPIFTQLRPSLSTFVREVCQRRQDIDSFIDVLKLLSSLVNLYGVGAISMVTEVAFADMDLNVGSLVSLLTRMIL